MTRLLWALLALFPSAASARPRPTALQVSAQHARYSGDCRKRVALEHVASFPVPVRAEGRVRWRLFYYPAGDVDGARQAYPPSALVEFDGNGRGADCSVKVDLPEAAPDKPLGAQLPKKAALLTAEDYEAREAALYRALETAANAFVEERRDEPARRAAREVLALFSAVSEPPLKPFYRALSPEFWAWAEAAAKP